MRRLNLYEAVETDDVDPELLDEDSRLVADDPTFQYLWDKYAQMDYPPDKVMSLALVELNRIPAWRVFASGAPDEDILEVVNSSNLTNRILNLIRSVLESTDRLQLLHKIEDIADLKSTMYPEEMLRHILDEVTDAEDLRRLAQSSAAMRELLQRPEVLQRIGYKMINEGIYLKPDEEVPDPPTNSFNDFIQWFERYFFSRRCNIDNKEDAYDCLCAAIKADDVELFSRVLGRYPEAVNEAICDGDISESVTLYNSKNIALYCLTLSDEELERARKVDLAIVFGTPQMLSNILHGLPKTERQKFYLPYLFFREVEDEEVTRIVLRFTKANNDTWTLSQLVNVVTRMGNKGLLFNVEDWARELLLTILYYNDAPVGDVRVITIGGLIQLGLLYKAAEWALLIKGYSSPIVLDLNISDIDVTERRHYLRTLLMCKNVNVVMNFEPNDSLREDLEQCIEDIERSSVRELGFYNVEYVKRLLARQ